MSTAKTKLNKEWHLAHPMPKNPTIEQRIEWHIEHHKHCGCRDIPESIKAEIKRRRGGKRQQGTKYKP